MCRDENCGWRKESRVQTSELWVEGMLSAEMRTVGRKGVDGCRGEGCGCGGAGSRDESCRWRRGANM